MAKFLDKDITKGVIGNAIFQVLWNGVSAMIGLYAAYSAQIRGVETHWVILIAVVIFFLLAFTMNLISLAIARHRKREKEKQNEPSMPVAENDDKKQIESLKAELDIRNDEIEDIKHFHAEEMEARKRGFDELQRKHDGLRAQLDEWQRYDWLVSIAVVQANDISDYVVVEQVRFCYHDLTAPIPFLIFGVDIHNKSVFNITIENAIEGHIELAGERLLGEKELIHNPKISPSGKESLTIKQRLSPVEVGLVSRCESSELGAVYYFDKVVIMVAARTELPQFERTSLKLPQHIGSKDTPFSTEIASLKAQLEEEKAKRTKPDITGKIKGVYCETWANGKLGDDGRVCFDYHFAVNAFVANRGAATTIEQFKLVLKVGERSYDGERERDAHDVKEGEIDWRAWGADELGDLEKSNNEPLEHSRNGWLWFVVFRVENTENKAEMELELYAIDKDGISYKLDTSPQPQWQKNPFKEKEMKAAARAEMRRHF